MRKEADHRGVVQRVTDPRRGESDAMVLGLFREALAQAGIGGNTTRNDDRFNAMLADGPHGFCDEHIDNGLL